MAQYGTLSTSQKAAFLIAQAATIRNPTTRVSLSGLNDITAYVSKIGTSRYIESISRGHQTLNIGSAELTASNRDNTFYTNGKSQVPQNTPIILHAGFSNLNVPIFSGIIEAVTPMVNSNSVIVTCKDHMELIKQLRVNGHQGTDNTVKKIMENMCGTIGVASDIDSLDEFTTAFDKPSLEPQNGFRAFERLSNAVFATAFFDEIGKLKLYKRNYANEVDWTYTDNNIYDSKQLAGSQITNNIKIEFRDNYHSKRISQASIDQYRDKQKDIRIPFLNYVEVSSKTSGFIIEELDNALEGFKITSSSDASHISSIAVRLKAETGGGIVTIKVYSDNAGSPSALLATSEDMYPGEFLTEEFAWEHFQFETPLEIDPSTAYWCIIDSSAATGTIYTQISGSAGTGLHAIGTWSLENNKHMLHIIRHSLQGQRVAYNIVRKFGDPIERISIIAPAVPHLQIMDSVMVDITEPFEVSGRFVIEGRIHNIINGSYTTTDTLARVE